MANYNIIFNSTDNSELYSSVECFLNQHKEIAIVIESSYGGKEAVSLDKSTAIKLAKTLRSEINKIEG
tara:strand:+ start:120 stop:323 length:204 start_codon:yes stop_codon:yes gene_type:complete